MNVNKFDTLILQATDMTIQDIDRKKFEKITFKSRKNFGRTIYKLDSNLLGIRSIVLNDTKEEIKIELSAKILRNKYYDLISIQNIELVVDMINKYSPITLFPDHFINHAIVFRVDVAKHIRLKKIIRDYLIAMRAELNKDKYVYTKYRHGLGVKCKFPTNKFRIIFYDKYLELNAGKTSNRVLLNYIDDIDFYQVMKVEQNLRKFADIRKAFDLKKEGAISLNDILYSEVNVLRNSFRKVLNISNVKTKETLRENIIHDKTKKPSEIYKMLGMLEVAEEFNNDSNLLKEFLSIHSKGNNLSYYMKDFREIISENQRKSTRTLNKNYMNLLKEIYSKLSIENDN